MTSFVKGKFDKLASIAIVTAALLLVGVTTAGYMTKKLQRFNTVIFSHSSDGGLLMIFMVTIIAAFVFVINHDHDLPKGPVKSPEFQERLALEKSTPKTSAEIQLLVQALKLIQVFHNC